MPPEGLSQPQPLRYRPPLDTDFIPHLYWERTYRSNTNAEAALLSCEAAICRPDGSCFRFRNLLLPHNDATADLNQILLDRWIKRLLWQVGGSTVLLAGCEPYVEQMRQTYQPDGPRAFDAELLGKQTYHQPLVFQSCPARELPEETSVHTGPRLSTSGCRIGFDLGASDRKIAAVRDGNVIHSEETPWNPGAASSSREIIEQVISDIGRAAAHLPTVDAIGGSAAGIVIHHELRVSSLGRGLSSDGQLELGQLVQHIQTAWPEVPVTLCNDGDVSALSGSRERPGQSILGLALGSSLAAGSCSAAGQLTGWLNELAFVPLDAGSNAVIDPWSGDRGCAGSYLSQRGVQRLAEKTGLADAAMSPPETLEYIQHLVEKTHPQAADIFRSIGVQLGWFTAHAQVYSPSDTVLLMGRVCSGAGGTLLVEAARSALHEALPATSCPELHLPDEQARRHGQAVTAALLCPE